MSKKTRLAGPKTVPESWSTNSWRPTARISAINTALAAKSAPIVTAIRGRRRASRKAARYNSATSGRSHFAIGLPKA